MIHSALTRQPEPPLPLVNVVKTTRLLYGIIGREPRGSYGPAWLTMLRLSVRRALEERHVFRTSQ